MLAGDDGFVGSLPKEPKKDDIVRFSYEKKILSKKLSAE